jgi:hypothetical protein
LRRLIPIVGFITASILVGSPQDSVARGDDPRLQKLQKFFAKWDCPLQYSAADFLIAADVNQLDWRLLPSISFLESSGGKNYKNNNVFGWDSCRESFPSVRAGIHIVASRLAKSKMYKDKSLSRKLRTYNPRPNYALEVRAIMNKLGSPVAMD